MCEARFSIVVAAILLAACSCSGPAESASLTSADAQSSSASAMAPATTFLPDGFAGKWDAKGGCTGSSDMALTITQTEMTFWESTAQITGVTVKSPEDVTVQAAFSGEGQTWTSPLHLTLSDNGNTLVVERDGESATRVRCPNP